MVLAEAVGSCTDLVATVLSPLVAREPWLEVAPLTVVVDPGRMADAEADRLPADVTYLFRKQIEEADVIVLTRGDLKVPDVEEVVAALNPRAPVLKVSGRSGEGAEEWLRAMPADLAPPLAIDYDRYARAEADLGWANATIHIRGQRPLDPTETIRRFLAALVDAPVVHVKVATLHPGGGSASLVRRGEAPSLETEALPPRAGSLRMIVNARVALPPADLESRLRGAADHAAEDGHVTWEDFECFRPARPEPRHRDTVRCRPGDPACCAAFYEREDVRRLLGDSFHPGGTDLTLSVGEELGLTHGWRVLDVACGQGTSLRALLERWDLEAVGLDAGANPSVDDRVLEFEPGDAHALPFADEDFDAVLCECAVSTFADQGAATAEMVRVLRPGGRLAVTDMVVEGQLPDELATWSELGTCLPGALKSDGYERLLENAGLRLVSSRLHPDAVLELLGRVKRNLVGLALASASGALGGDLPFDVRIAKDLLAAAREAVEDGRLSYGVFVAERPV